MPIFISYSHQDKAFVDELAKQLVRHHVNIWLDRWELSIGDSILEQVQSAIDESSALLVVLSQASVKSEWCKRELSSGLLKELEERRVFVMPVLLDDCDIPLFARGKLYADFRSSFDDGLGVILEGVAKITNPNLARFKEPEYHVDHAMDWQTGNELVLIRLTYVEQARGQPYTCLTVINILIEGEAKAVYDSYCEQADDAIARFRVMEALHLHLEERDILKLRLPDTFERTTKLSFKGNFGETYLATIATRRLGEDTGRDILVNVSSLIAKAYNHERGVLGVGISGRSREPTKHE